MEPRTITTNKTCLRVNFILAGLIVPTLFIIGNIADKTPSWGMLQKDYLIMIVFLFIFMISGNKPDEDSILKLAGYAGCMFMIFIIFILVSFMQNLPV